MNTEVLSDVLLLGATALLMMLYVPQIWKTYTSKEVEAFSMKTMVMRAIANVLVICYGGLQNLPVIIVSASAVVCAEMVMISMKVMYSK